MKSLLRAAVVMAASLSFLMDASADVPAFLILQDGVFIEQARAIENAGVRIRQRVPPHVLIVDLPDGTKTSSLPGVRLSYLSAVPAASLEPQGPTAVAAAIQWNRRMLTQTRAVNGVSSMGAMRQMVADRSLPPPVNARISPLNGHLVCEWEGVDGAIYYEVQASGSRLFEGASIRTNSLKTRVELPVPDGADEVSVRVRAIDPGDATPDDDVIGRWSQPGVTNVVSLPSESPVSAPTLTSPVEGFQTEGFTLILEWSPGDGPTRVQVARDNSFSDVLFDEIVTGGEYACPGPALRSGERLKWRVQSWNGGRSAWTGSRTARIGEPRSNKIDAFVNPEAPQ